MITGLYTPYKKPNNNLVCTNTSSSHLPCSINLRLFENSANEQVFNTVYKIFHRNTIKVSYSCIQIIKQHNRNVSNKKENQTNPYNCRNKNKCPLNRNCKVHNVIYKCTLSATQTFKRVYLGITEGNWKQQSYNHRQSFKDTKHKNDTTLSCYLWDLNENHNQIPKLT